MSDEVVQWPGLVFDAIDAGLAVLDHEGRVRAWNSCMASLTGIPAAATIGKTLAEALDAPVPTRLTVAIEHAIGAGASSMLSHTLYPGLLPLPPRLGRPVLHNVAVAPIGDGECLLHVSDVTTTASREKVLRERQNARYDAVVDSAPDAILTVDAEGVIQWVNKAVERSLGYASIEIVGRPIAALLSDEKVGGALSELLQGVALTRPIEIMGRHRDGHVIDLEFSASRWLSQDRAFVTAILRDITARKIQDRALRRLNVTLESIAAERTADRDRMWLLSSDLMIVAHRDGTITATNPAANMQLGATDDRLVGSNIRDLFVEADRARWDEEIKSMASASEPRRFELRVQTGDGKSRWIDWNAVAADDFVQAVGRDITSEKDAEVALHSAEAALRQSQKMDAIGQLTGGIAHDFNNLLAGVIGAMEIVKRRLHTGRTEDLTRFTDAAIASANRAAALTHRLLAFSRQQPLDPQPHDVNEIIVGMEDLARRSVGEQIKVRTYLSPNIGLAATDGNQLENAILNLVINARDAMPDGGSIEIATSSTVIDKRQAALMDGVEPGPYICVSVKDTGTGMPAEVIARAFDPFFTTKPIGKGTGLGLSMIYGFAKQSKGHARIESEVGRGTTVTLYLPKSPASAAPAAWEVAQQAPRGKGETVLVIEDDASVRLLITEVLHELGYAAIEVGDSRGALPILTSDARLDLIVSDVGLPGMDGKKLAEIARQHRPDIRILFVTGYAEHAKVRGEFLSEGMDMITKPFSLDVLGHKVREMLS